MSSVARQVSTSAHIIKSLAVIDERVYVISGDGRYIRVYDTQLNHLILRPSPVYPEIPECIVAVKLRKSKPESSNSRIFTDRTQLPDIVECCGKKPAMSPVWQGFSLDHPRIEENEGPTKIYNTTSVGLSHSISAALVICLKSSKVIACVNPADGSILCKIKCKKKPVAMSVTSFDDVTTDDGVTPCADSTSDNDATTPASVKSQAITSSFNDQTTSRTTKKRSDIISKLAVLCGHSSCYSVNVYVVNTCTIAPFPTRFEFLCEISLGAFNSVHGAILLPASAATNKLLLTCEDKICIVSCEMLSTKPLTSVRFVATSELCLDISLPRRLSLDRVHSGPVSQDKSMFPADVVVDPAGAVAYIAMCSEGRVVRLDLELRDMLSSGSPCDVKNDDDCFLVPERGLRRGGSWSEWKGEHPYRLCLDAHGRLLVGCGNGTVVVLHCDDFKVY